MQGSVLVVANAVASGVCFRSTGGVSGIHMSGDYFGLRGGRVETFRMGGNTCVYISVWVSCT